MATIRHRPYSKLKPLALGLAVALAPKRQRDAEIKEAVKRAPQVPAKA